MILRSSQFHAHGKRGPGSRLALLVMLLAAIPYASKVCGESPCIVPDEEYRRLLGDIYESPSGEEGERRMAVFLERANKSRVHSLQQVFSFLSPGPGPEERNYHFFLFAFTSLKPTKAEMLESVLPCLESQDDSIDKLIRETAIPFISSSTDPNAPDPSVFLDYFRAKRQDPPTKLIKLLYQFSPGTGLELMLDFHVTDEPSKEQIRQKRDLIGKDEVRVIFDPDKMKADPASGVADALNECIQSPHWWVRLYAVEVARRGMDFDRTPIIERLKNDPEEIVRDAVQSLEGSIPR